MTTQKNQIDITHNSHIDKEGWWSTQQVISLLSQVQIFANSNGKDGLIDVAGENYEERAQVMMNSFLHSHNTVEAIGKFKIPLNEYLT